MRMFWNSILRQEGRSLDSRRESPRLPPAPPPFRLRLPPLPPRPPPLRPDFPALRPLPPPLRPGTRCPTPHPPSPTGFLPRPKPGPPPRKPRLPLKRPLVGVDVDLSGFVGGFRPAWRAGTLRRDPSTITPEH